MKGIDYVLNELRLQDIDVHRVNNVSNDCVIRLNNQNESKIKILTIRAKSDTNSAAHFTQVKPKQNEFILFYASEVGDCGTYWIFSSVELDKLAKDKTVENVQDYANGIDIDLAEKKERRACPKSQFYSYEVDLSNLLDRLRAKKTIQ
jgi:hypothetical protein